MKALETSKHKLEADYSLHKAHAESTRVHMQEQIQKSRDDYLLARCLRFLAIFAKGKELKALFTRLWQTHISQMKFVFIADY